MSVTELLPPTADGTSDDSSPPSSADSHEAIDDLLPPGAGDGDDRAAEEVATVSDHDRRVADELLPPSTGLDDAEPGEQVPLPARAALPETDPDTILIPTDEGGHVALRQPVKTIGTGEDERELRQLTDEEKASRRRLRMIVVWVAGTLVLLITLGILLLMGPL